MALFDFGKKKAEERAPEAGPSGKARIQVLGSGCKNCHTLLENTQEAVRSLGLNVDVAYVQDMATIASYGVMSLPALVVHGKVVSTGKVLKPAQIEALLKDGEE